MQTVLDKLRPLTQEERLQAKNSAHNAVRASYGNAPSREDYVTDSALHMTWVDKLIWVLCTLVLTAAFSLSAMRLYHIGRMTFEHSISDATQAIIGGIAIVVLAEATQLISALALAKVRDDAFRYALYAVAIGATLIAIIGNVQIVQPWTMTGAFTFLPEWVHSPFAWLEALFPPIAVLAMAHVLKHQLLDAIAIFEERKLAYKRAVEEWQRNVNANAEQHPDWTRFYSNALRDRIIRAHARVASAKDILPALTTADWRALVYREMQADNWYAEPMQNIPVDAQPRVPAPPVQTLAPIKSRTKRRSNFGNSTDEIRNAVQLAVHTQDGVVVRCPHCAYEVTKADEESARMALTAHIGRWCKGRPVVALHMNGNHA